jgi:hypothetical protein
VDSSVNGKNNVAAPSGQQDMKSAEWKTYRTRFLVKAKQLSSNLSFTDHLGRQHCGRKGDYLVESCDGVLSIAPRQIFEDIYVPMGLAPPSPQTSSAESEVADEFCSQALAVESLRIEKVKAPFRATASQGGLNPERSARVYRKSPQPVRISPTRLSLM